MFDAIDAVRNTLDGRRSPSPFRLAIWSFKNPTTKQRRPLFLIDLSIQAQGGSWPEPGSQPTPLTQRAYSLSPAPVHLEAGKPGAETHTLAVC